MTRETKIGLVVGFSFLCLVGIVVASKWRTGDDPSYEQDDRNPDVKLAQNGDTKGKDGAKKNDKPVTLPVLPVQPLPNKDSGKIEKKQFDPMPIPAPVSFGALSEQEKLQQLIDAKKRNEAQAVLPPPGGLQLSELKPIGEGQNTVVPPPQAVMPLERKDGFSPQPIERKDGFVPPPAIDFPIRPVEKKVGFVPPPAVDLPIKPLEKKDGFVPPPAVDFPIKPVEKKDGFVPPATTFGQDNVSAPKPFGQIEPKNNGVELPKFDQFGKGPPPFKPLEAPPIVPVAKDPLPIKPFETPPAQKEIPTIPSFNSNVSTPPIGISSPKPMPIVRDSSPDVYECKPGDNSFAILSQRFYGTDRYAEALQAYNRTYSGALKNGQNLTGNQPILQPGRQVLVPHRELLERDVRTPVISIAPPPAVKIVPPSPVSPAGGVSVPVAPSIGGGRNYIVQNPNGESILDIAERTLGKRDRWTDIYRLNQSNPNVQPQSLQRIPAGTELKMPGN